MNKIKTFKSPNYNFVFDTKSGFFARWGKTKEDDPEFSPFGPEIMDIEISTICSRGCSWCYKSNDYIGKNMSFETFKDIFDTFPKHLTQIAFGIGDIDGNPDLWKIMRYCRENQVIPNITINGERMTSELYNRLADVCGAVAVSLYNKNICYDAVKELTDRGIQTNIHALLSKETYDNCYTTLLDRKTDKRLVDLNAVVFLWLKPKGERNVLHPARTKKLKELVDKALETGGKFGFDSCTAPMFMEAVKDRSEFEQYKTMAESCESCLFSGYISTEGLYFPCSFAEGVGEWATGIPVTAYKDFNDVWHHPLVEKFRKQSIATVDCNDCRRCLVYDL